MVIIHLKKIFFMELYSVYQLYLKTYNEFKESSMGGGEVNKEEKQQAHEQNVKLLVKMEMGVPFTKIGDIRKADNLLKNNSDFLEHYVSINELEVIT